MPRSASDEMIADAVNKVVEEEFDVYPQPGPQELLLECPYKEILFGGARGGGKSFATMLYCYKHAKENGKDAKILFLRRSYKELEDFMEKCQDFFPQLGWTWKAGITTWISPEGTLLKLRHLERDEDAMAYQGHGYTLVIIEEAGNFKSREPIRKLKGAMRSGSGVRSVMIMTANPGGPGHEWLKERFVDPAPPYTPIEDEHGSIRIFIPSKLSDNRILMDNDPDYVKNLYDSGPKRIVDAWLHGEWDITDPGNIFKYENWRYYDTPPTYGKIWQSWDTAFKKTDKSDRSAYITGMTTPHGIYILDAWAGKVEFPELKKIAYRKGISFRPYIAYIEDKASGQSLAQELKRPLAEFNTSYRLPVMAVKVDGDKLARAWASAPPVEQGLIFLPRKAPWLEDFRRELESFPNGSYDDWVDAFSQGVTRQKIFLSKGSEPNQEQKRAQKKALGSIFVR